MNPVPEFPGTYPGTVKPVPDCVALTRAATLVCVGDVAAVRKRDSLMYRVQGTAEQFEELDAEVRVRQVLKGRWSGAAVHVLFLRAAYPTSLESLAPGERALLFLVREGGHARFADAVNGKLSVSGRGPYPGATPVARVLSALGSAARSKRSGISTPAILLLGQASAPEAVEHLRRLSKSGPPAARQAAAEAFQASIRRGRRK